MVESFSFEEENFIDDIYNMKMSVSFNKKKVFRYLEEKNIFPSIPLKNKFLFIPIVIDENKKDLLIFDNNKIFEEWNKISEEYNLIEYILPTEDLEDLNLVKKNIESLENFEFREIVKKYNIENYIISIFFIGSDQTRLLNKIIFDDKKTLKNILIKNIDFKNNSEIDKFIEKLKINFEDYWKSQNEINTSVKLPLTISVGNSDNIKIYQLEEKLSNLDLIYNFFIYKFDNKNNIYKVIFNGTPDKFIKVMENNNYEFETVNKIWVMK